MRERGLYMPERFSLSISLYAQQPLCPCPLHTQFFCSVGQLCVCLHMLRLINKAFVNRNHKQRKYKEKSSMIDA